MVRFIHAADLHLDSPFIGLKSLPDFLWEQIYQSTFQSFTKVVDLAIEKQVDFLCIAGDIYDSEDRSVKAQAYLRNELIRLEVAEIPVFICHGNHDYIENLGLHLDMPVNVVIFNEAVETHWLTTKRNERIAITSFSYHQRWIKERRIEEYPLRSSDAHYQIGMLHGSSEGIASEHGIYAPFSLAELKSKKYDYWALGHIHKRQFLSENPLIVYSGNTQGRSSKETGAKGCELVELTENGAKHEFYETAPIKWQSKELSLKGLKNLGEVYQAIQSYLSQLKEQDQGQFIALSLKDSDELNLSVSKKIQSGELLEALQQINPVDQPFIWVYKLSIIEATSSQSDLNFLTKEWQVALKKIHEEVTFNEATNFLFDQIDSGEQLDSRDSDYRQQIVADGKALIMQQLGIEGSEIYED
ncbi:metallophosphoesterase family protein [Carnobacterium gallinarum]|uniref:metallophosphoesterase family protein n=1 Tax=Carnobacterium gallinarum TaxID=2749 RepID=UPI00054E1A39|nr:DNA repair exonuclease [Carnobacterium gallinarum]